MKKDKMIPVKDNNKMSSNGGYNPDPKGSTGGGYTDGKEWDKKKESKDSLNGWAGSKKKGK
jgi:hypothetical protein